MKMLLAVVIGGLVLIVGCVAIISAGINEGVEEAEKEQDAKGITLSEFRSVKQGTSQSKVESRLGSPENAQEFENEIPELQEGPSRSSCIYYPEKGKPLFEGRSFQFCFDDGKLTSKNAY
jgi:adenine-specific DNA methylase